MKKNIYLIYLILSGILFVCFLYTRKEPNMQNVRVKNSTYKTKAFDSGATIYADLYSIKNDSLICERCEIPHKQVIAMIENNTDTIFVNISDNSLSKIFINLVLTVAVLIFIYFTLIKFT
jgi:hypothetical protein